MKKYIVDPSVASSGFRAGGPHVYNTSAQMAPSSQPAVPMFGGPAFTPAPAYTHQEYGPGYGGQHLQQQQQQGPNPVNTYQSYKSPTPPLTQQPVPAFRPNQSNNVPFKPPGNSVILLKFKLFYDYYYFHEEHMGITLVLFQYLSCT